MTSGSQAMWDVLERESDRVGLFARFLECVPVARDGCRQKDRPRVRENGTISTWKICPSPAVSNVIILLLKHFERRRKVLTLTSAMASQKSVTSCVRSRLFLDGKILTSQVLQNISPSFLVFVCLFVCACLSPVVGSRARELAIISLPQWFICVCYHTAIPRFQNAGKASVNTASRKG